MHQTFIHMIQAATIALFLLFGVFMLNFKGGRPLSNRLLGVFLITKGVSTASLFIRLALTRENIDLSPHFAHVFRPFAFIYGPALYLYVVSILRPSWRFTWQSTLHFIPAFACAIYLSLTFYHLDAPTKQSLIENKQTLIGWERFFIFQIRFYSIIAYSTSALCQIYNYRKTLRDNYSNLEKARLSWLSYLIWGMALLWSWAAFGQYLRPLLPNTKAVFLTGKYSSSILLLIFACSLVYKTLKSSEFLQKQEEAPKPKPPEQAKPVNLADMKILLNALEVDRSYLEPGLTLGDLSKTTGLSSRHISVLIRERYGMNFYNAINRLRIEESKKLLLDSNKKRTVSEILYEVGFSSKSAFNKVFKERIGVTPTQYREENGANSGKDGSKSVHLSA